MMHYDKQAAVWRGEQQRSVIVTHYTVHPLPLTRRSPQGEKRDCGAYSMASQGQGGGAALALVPSMGEEGRG
jgi:hypothetical protein